MKNNKNILVVMMLVCATNAFASMRPLPPVPMSTITMDAILTGALGNDMQGTPYAWKANQIYRYNYTAAMRRGSPNLNLALDNEIRNVNANSSMAQYSKMLSLKNTIDAFHAALEGYRSADAAMNPISSRPITVTPVQTLSLQGILNGALGEPYTSKAKEVYNSGVTSYVDDMTRGINNAINANYPDESKRTDSIKLFIDRNYNFLMNYRKNNQQPVYVPAPPMALSLQSILSGALGEPYTSKANRVYNSGVSFYVDDMTRGINNAINASYPDESRRRDAIKMSIDRNYNFLMSYLKNNAY